MDHGQTHWATYDVSVVFTTTFVLCPQSFGNPLAMAQSVVVYGSFLVQLYAYCWFGSELTRLVK
jgi:hypothetical protein